MTVIPSLPREQGAAELKVQAILDFRLYPLFIHDYILRLGPAWTTWDLVSPKYTENKIMLVLGLSCIQVYCVNLSYWIYIRIYDMIYVFMSPFYLRTLSSRENFFLVGSVLAILMSRTSLSYFYHLFSFPNGMICWRTKGKNGT